MPRMDARGRCLMGTGGLPGSVDGRPYPFAADGGGCWIEDDGRPIARILVQLQPQSVLATWLPDAWDIPPEVIAPARGANDFAAGGGRWVALLAGAPPRLYGNTIGTRWGAGMGSVASDGTIAYKTDYFADRGLTIVPPSGPEIVMPDAVPVDVQALPGGRALWRGGAYGRDPLKLALPALRPLLVTIAGEDWVIYWHATASDADSLGLIAQIDGQAVGYILAPGIFTHHYAARNVDDELVVAYSVKPGEGPGDLRVLTVDRTRPRVRLVAVSTPTPSPTPTPTPPKPPAPTPQPVPPKEPPMVNLTLHDWTVVEWPQVVNARRTALGDPTWEPDPAWVILQMARRYGLGLAAGEAPWTLRKMIDHELRAEGGVPNPQ